MGWGRDTLVNRGWDWWQLPREADAFFTHTLSLISMALDVFLRASEMVRAARPDTNKKFDYASDHDLVSACLRGDDGSAWQRLVERYGTLVFSIPRRLGLTEADAEDVFQNVFLIAYRRLATLKNHTTLCAWLIRVTYHESLHLCQRLPDDTELAEEIVDLAANLPETVEQWDRRVMVQEAIRQLDPRSQTLLQALYFEPRPLSYEEIARRLGLSLGSIGPTRARSLKKLEGILVQMGAGALFP
jgi:RNA polymerase sigma factor (sigma-70 family)